jgi:adenosylhomocysteine nucleosidase
MFRRELWALAFLGLLGCASTSAGRPLVVIVSADTEWRVLHATLHEPDGGEAGREWFVHRYATRRGPREVIFFHGGSGKIRAAATAQLAIDRWHPRLLVNLGTCGGFEGRTKVGEVFLAARTVVYDLYEAMTDPEETVQMFATTLDPTLVPASVRAQVRVDVLVSGDRDLVPHEVPELERRFSASAGDWESGAIAWTARHADTPVVILRGVSDVVGAGGDAAYGDVAVFEAGTRVVMRRLLELFGEAMESW